VLDVDALMAAITGAEGQHSRDIGRDLPLKTAVLHKRRCSTSTVQRGGQTRQGGARLDVDETTPRYGGVRSWWLCPACGGRVTTLYLPPGVSAPACRSCYRLTYKTRQAHDKRDDRYRRLPPWERLALLHTMTMADREPLNMGDVPRAQWPHEIMRVLAGADELARLLNSLKAPCHSMDYYERRANR